MTAVTINTITLGIVNAHLIQSEDDFFLIDTGYAKNQKQLDEALQKAGCTKGHLKLIILTHGDGDHSGNAAYLRESYGSLIAMSKGDAKMVETGDESSSRKSKPDHLSLLFKLIMKLGVMKKQNQFIGFTPDLFLDDGQDLNPYGLKASILTLPGHTKGSIGVLTTEGDLFCGDLMYNLPGFGFIDDAVEHRLSIERVNQLQPRLIYPGHGKAFVLKSTG